MCGKTYSRTRMHGEYVGQNIVNIIHITTITVITVNYIYHWFIVRFPIGLDFLFLHNIPSSEVLMKSIGTEILRPDSFPGVNHMRGKELKTIKYTYA